MSRRINAEVMKQTADIRVSPFESGNQNQEEGIMERFVDKQDFESQMKGKASKKNYESCLTYINILHS